MKPLLCLALGIAVGVVIGLNAVYHQEPADELPQDADSFDNAWQEGDDGLPPADPYLWPTIRTNEVTRAAGTVVVGGWPPDQRWTA